jgi:hypothetical protein
MTARHKQSATDDDGTSGEVPISCLHRSSRDRLPAADESDDERVALSRRAKAPHLHRQITFDALDTETGEVVRGRIESSPPAIARWVTRFGGQELHAAGD